MSEHATDPTRELACPFEALVERRVLGDASDEESSRLDAHVAQGCPSCAPRVAEQDHLERLISGAFRPLEREIEERRGPVADKLQEALDREDARKGARRRRRVGMNTLLFFILATGLVLIAAEYAMYVTAYKKMVKAQSVAAETEVHALVVALDRYAREHGALPPETPGLAETLGATRSAGDRPYYSPDPRRVHQGQLLDPWGRAYVYRKLPDGALVFSPGPNGRDESGNGDDIARRLIFIPKH